MEIFINILFPVFLTAILGFAFGSLLGYTYKKFFVTKDKRIEMLEKILPSMNCGACGFPGCSGYADSIVFKGTDITQCAPGGNKVIGEIAKILGKSAPIKEKLVARVKCAGDYTNSSYKYVYNGISDCLQANTIFSGHKECSYGCLGLGSCFRACNFDAILIDENGRVHINPNKCTACGACIPVCPTNIIELVPLKNLLYNACNSKDKAYIVKKLCSVGCISCKLCEKACKYNAIHVNESLAVFDWDKCTNCNACFLVCPTKCIHSNVSEAKEVDF